MDPPPPLPPEDVEETLASLLAWFRNQRQERGEGSGGGEGMEVAKRRGKSGPKPKRRKGRRLRTLNLEDKQWVKDFKDGKIERDQDNGVRDEVCELPATLSVPLLPYQKEWLAWAVKKEGSETKGGILLDEYGMGKKIQAIALVLYKLGMEQSNNEVHELPLQPGPSDALLEIKTTLIICLPIAMTQWKNEIKRCTSGESTKVFFYEKLDQGLRHQDLSSYDVITLYDIVYLNHIHNYETPSAGEDSNLEYPLYSVKWECIILNEDAIPYGSLTHLEMMCAVFDLKWECIILNEDAIPYGSLTHLEMMCAVFDLKWECIILNEDGKIERDQDNGVRDEVCELPATLSVPLLPYQKEWLAWAVKKEGSETKGGILLDEYGMGKKIQAIALVLYKLGMEQSNNEVHELPLQPGPSDALLEIKTTLIICLPIAMTQWKNEIKRCTSGESTKVFFYEKLDQGLRHQDLSSYDVITLYDIVYLNHIHNYETPSAGEDSNLEYPLYSVKWECIILNEADFLNGEFPCSRAVFALESSYRYAFYEFPHTVTTCAKIVIAFCLNIVTHLYRHFLGVKHMFMAGFFKPDGHIKYVVMPIKQRQRKAEDTKILFENRILPGLLLRHTKEGRAADLALPPRTLSVRRDALDDVEEDRYKSVYTETLEEFNGAMQCLLLSIILLLPCKGKRACYQAHRQVMGLQEILKILLKLCGTWRSTIFEAVNHPYLVELGAAKEHCEGCCKKVKIPVGCIRLSTEQQASCPSCEKSEKKDKDKKQKKKKEKEKISSPPDRAAPRSMRLKTKSILDYIKLDTFQTSTKIEALSGIACVRLVETLEMADRENAIKKFNQDPECRIILSELAPENVTLNLTVASHVSALVFLMDAWWNTADERQAMDTIYKIGQRKPIRILKFIMENTVDERIFKLQEKKKQELEWTIGRFRFKRMEQMSRDDDLKFVLTPEDM
ncbi:ATP-dependent helicase rhp16-like protein [Drosera capensis]